MSWINEVGLRNFYRKKLVPVAEELHARGVRHFSLGPEIEASTWYTRPCGGEEISTFEEGDAGRSLEALWEDECLPELSSLVDELMKLASRSGPILDIESEVSSSLYVMY